MLNKMSLLLAAAAVAVGAGAAIAAPSDRDHRGNDHNNSAPYAAGHQNGYGNGYNYGYDDGFARRERNDHYRSDAYRAEVRHDGYERGAYYYGSDCGANAATGTVLGAIAGGLIGSAASHGNGGAVVGGVILGGLAGNAIASDMNCSDRRYALASYRQGFDGRIGHRYDWRNHEDGSYGYFTPVREYSRRGASCRDFSEVSYRGGHKYDHRGTACRQSDGNWHLE